MEGQNIFDRFLIYDLEVLPFVFLALVIAFTLHEFAHAYTAWKFGDPTAKEQGRVTLNPIVHLDILGTILIFLAGFGWAKPVPVRRHFFRRPRAMGIAVSLAGPLSNLLIAFVGMIFYYVLILSGASATLSEGVFAAADVFLRILIQLNLVLFLFNLLPVPPLDGYRILEDLAPPHLRARMTQNEHWGVFIFLLLVFIPPLRMMTIEPLFSLTDDLSAAMAKLIALFFGA